MVGSIIVNFILAVLSTYVLFEYYCTFFREGYNKIANFIVMGLYCIWQTASLAFFGNMPIWMRLIISILFVMAVCFCFYGDFLGKIIFAIIYNAIWMLGELLIATFFLLIGISISEYEILGSFLSKFVLLLMIKLLQKFFYNETIGMLSWKENVMLMSLPIGSMYFIHHIFILSSKVDEKKYFFISIVIIVAILCVNCVMLSMYIKLSERFELKRQNSIFQLEIDLYNKHIKEKEHAMVEFRKMKHDLKNRLFYLLDLLRENNIYAAEEYIKDLVDLKSMEGFTVAHSDNSLIDALVNYKYETAKQYGIRFRVTLDIPISFPLANADLCVILGNALDNAIEANMKGDIFDPYIDLKMKYDRKNLIIIIENSFDGLIKKDAKGNLITLKLDKMNHGMGMTSIQKALEKYNGYMKTEIEDAVYKLWIIMYDTEKLDEKD